MGRSSFLWVMRDSTYFQFSSVPSNFFRFLCLWAHRFVTSYVWSMRTCHPSVASSILLYTLVWRTYLPKFILYRFGASTKTACLKLTAKDLWSFCWPFDSHLLHIIWAFPAFQNDWKLYLHQIWMDFTGQGFWLKKCITVHCPYNLLTKFLTFNHRCLSPVGLVTTISPTPPPYLLQLWLPWNSSPQPTQPSIMNSLLAYHI